MKPKLIYKMPVNRNLLFFIFFVLVSCPVMGQAKQKKQLTVADYGLWNLMESEAVSNKGLWVSYTLRYKSGLDTLFVRRTMDKKTFAYPLGRNGKFCGEKWYACNNDKDMLQLTNLENGKIESFTEISEYEFSKNGKYLVLSSKKSATTNTLTIRNLSNGKDSVITNITGWRFNNDLNLLAYCVETAHGSEAKIVTMQDFDSSVDQLQFYGKIGTHIIWQKNNASVVVVLKTLNASKEVNALNTQLVQYRFADKQLFELDTKKLETFSRNKHIEVNYSNDVGISDDGKRIFFQTLPDTIIKNEDPIVEVWNGEDKLLQSEVKMYGNIDDMPKTAVWYPDTAGVFEFMTQEINVIFSTNSQYALTYSFEPCEKQFKFAYDRDYYLTNLITQEQKLWLHCHSALADDVTFMSPNGKYIAYYKEGNWFIYNIASELHSNITAGVGAAFYDEANDMPDQPKSYGFYGWTANDQSILVYDQFDIWEIATDGSFAKRLTKGREKNTKFRIIKTNPDSSSLNFLSRAPREVVDLNTTFLLKAISADNKNEGFCILEKGNEKTLEFSSHYIRKILKATDAEVYVYVQEDYEHPPSLQIKKGNKGKPKCIFQSNPQHDNYHWGKVSTIHYNNDKGETLTGLLYYPSNYKKGTSYPMIVYIYQKLSQTINQYKSPSVNLYSGFNVTNMVTNGYFVLLPDINYTIGSPGESATDCVTSAVKQVLKLGDVNPKKTGLIGHSFGGFETTYIIGKSNLFAAAIAGAAQTDYLSGYFTVSENYKKAEFWRYEFFQNRMGKPLFEDLEGYIHNSAVYNSPTIETPLLLWTGAKDGHVSPLQSMELFLAMRRQGKKVTMLRYPEEDHSLENELKQADLAQKVMDWFDYYLKDQPAKKWML